MKHSLPAILALACALALAVPARAERPKLIIHDGGSLVVNSSSVDLHCGQLVVEDGGQLDGLDARFKHIGASRYEEGALLFLQDTLFYRCPQPWLHLLDMP